MEKRNLTKYTFFILIGMLFLNILTVFAVDPIDYKDYTGSISALSSGYAITRWPTGSGDTYPGQTVVVRAVTTDLTATQVRIRWIRPDGTVPKNLIHDLNPTDPQNTYDGAPVIEAEDSFTIDMLDKDGKSWGVQAIFLYSDGPVGGPDGDQFLSIKAISYHSTPEIPFGTITTIATMLAASGFFILKRK